MSSTKTPGAGRIGGFARYFKGYMGASAVVVAALPIPVAGFRLIPAYAAQRGFLGVYTSLFAFLILAFLFYSRHWIAGSMFAPGEGGSCQARPMAAWFPLLLMACSLGMVFGYHAALDASIADRAQVFALVGIKPPDAHEILEKTAVSDVPRATLLMVLYLAIFLCAEAAFVMMALREYLQDLLGIPEQELLRRPKKRKAKATGE